jgi:hypothetical protein
MSLARIHSLQSFKVAGLAKSEDVITEPQQARVFLRGPRQTTHPTSYEFWGEILRAIGAPRSKVNPRDLIKAIEKVVHLADQR